MMVEGEFYGSYFGKIAELETGFISYNYSLGNQERLFDKSDNLYNVYKRFIFQLILFTST
ncbi:hypothetical protein BZG42_03050 [Streptococcus sp. DAT741]|nr:hypothetical protein BZG42_03050 [Streptococcus sp. DAT741]